MIHIRMKHLHQFVFYECQLHNVPSSPMGRVYKRLLAVHGWQKNCSTKQRIDIIQYITIEHSVNTRTTLYTRQHPSWWGTNFGNMPSKEFTREREREMKAPFRPSFSSYKTAIITTHDSKYLQWKDSLSLNVLS